jgi:hypothetical protein
MSGEEASEETSHVDTLISDFCLPELDRINFYYLSHPVYIIITALAN